MSLPETHIRSRRSVSGIFLLWGFIFASWLVNIPAVQERTQVSPATLGLLILLLGLGSLLSMQITGWLIDKVGSRIAVIVGATVIIGGLNLPGLASDGATLGLALFTFGLGLGAIDVAMNDQAVNIERSYKRPIMSSFHAWGSAGCGIGAGAGALMQSLNMGLHAMLLSVTAVGLVAAAVAVPGLVAPVKSALRTGPKEQAAPGPAEVRARMVALASLAFLIMMAEGVANDWSALHAVEHLHQTAAHASLAYGSFAVLMTIGRFTGDRVAAAFGPIRIVRWGSAVAAAGMALVLFSTSYPLTLVGWAIFGAGLAGIVPQIFTAAGNLGGSRQGVALSRVVGLGYVGQLAGPALIGWVAAGITLAWAMTVPLAFCVVGIFLAPALARKRRASASHQVGLLSNQAK